MIGVSGIGQVSVMTTDNRGFTPEELAQEARKRIISMGANTHPTIRAQAEAYAADIEKVIAHYMRQAIRSDRTTIYNALVDTGHPDLAKLVKEL